MAQMLTTFIDSMSFCSFVIFRFYLAVVDISSCGKRFVLNFMENTRSPEGRLTVVNPSTFMATVRVSTPLITPGVEMTFSINAGCSHTVVIPIDILMCGTQIENKGRSHMLTTYIDYYEACIHVYMHFMLSKV